MHVVLCGRISEPGTFACGFGLIVHTVVLAEWRAAASTLASDAYAVAQGRLRCPELALLDLFVPAGLGLREGQLALQRKCTDIMKKDTEYRHLHEDSGQPSAMWFEAEELIKAAVAEWAIQVAVRTSGIHALVVMFASIDLQTPARDLLLKFMAECCMIFHMKPMQAAFGNA